MTNGRRIRRNSRKVRGQDAEKALRKFFSGVARRWEEKDVKDIKDVNKLRLGWRGSGIDSTGWKTRLRSWRCRDAPRLLWGVSLISVRPCLS